MEVRIRKLKEWMKKGRAGPFLVEVWPTNRCNLRCIMCGTWANRRRLEMGGIRYNPVDEIRNEVSEKRLLRLVAEAKELDVREFLITGGGEPLIRKKTTLNLMKKIKLMGFLGNLNTNGTLLTKTDVGYIVEMEWDMVMFSVDAPDAKTHDRIRGVKGCFKKVKENLLAFKKLKKKLRSEKPKIVFNTVLSNKIYDKVDRLIKFASQVGCEDITFIPLIPYDDFAERIKLTQHQKIKLMERLEKLIDLSRKLGVKTNLDDLLFSAPSGEMDKKILEEIKNSPKDLIHSPCFEPFLHFLVKANGESTFCCMIEGSPENVKEKSLKEIWFGEYFEEQRRNFINKRIREECKFCVFSQFLQNKKIRRNLY